MNSIALVVVSGGVAEVFQPLHVDVRVVDLDNIHDRNEGDAPEKLPRNVGFEHLVKGAGLKEGAEFVWEN